MDTDTDRTRSTSTLGAMALAGKVCRVGGRGGGSALGERRAVEKVVMMGG